MGHEDRPEQILWSLKDGKEPGEWYTEIGVVLSEYKRKSDKNPYKL